MFDFHTLQNILHLINQQPLALQMACVLLAYAIAPACGVPIMLITYGTACLFGLKIGFFLALLGYCLSLVILFEGAVSLQKRRFIKESLEKLTLRFPLLATQLSFPMVVGFACIMPYLPLVILLGLTQEKRMSTYGALLLGSLPAFAIALQAGALGNGILVGMSSKRLIFSLVTLATALMIHLWIFNKTKKKIASK